MKSKLIIAFILLAISSSSYSCTCNQVDYDNLVSGSSAVVLVTLESFDHLPPSNPLFPPMNLLKFSIDKVLSNPRNKISTQTTSISAMSSATPETCGMPAVKGAQYFLFLNENDFINNVTLSICDGSLMIDRHAYRHIPSIYRAIDKLN